MRRVHRSRDSCLVSKHLPDVIICETVNDRTMITVNISGFRFENHMLPVQGYDNVVDIGEQKTHQNRALSLRRSLTKPLSKATTFFIAMHLSRECARR